MQYFCRVAGAVTLTCLAFSNPAQAADDASAACNAIMDGYSAAVASGDPANVGATFVSDGESVSGWGILKGSDAITKALAAFIKPGARHADTLMSARKVGDVVICSGDYTATSPALPAPMKGFWTKVLVKVGSDWKIVVLTSNVLPPT